VSLPDDRMLLCLVDELESQPVDEGELHRLGVLFRHRGPAPAGLREWLASLLVTATPDMATVRGGAAQQLLEYEAGPHRLMLELLPRLDQPAVDLHGQLFTDDEEAGRAGVVVSWGGTEQVSTETDELGEFHLPGLPVGSYRLTCHLPQSRIVIANLAGPEDGAA